jgi:hypothetical protein
MKTPLRTILLLLAAGLFSHAFFSRQAQAAPINGTIDFGGVVTFGDSTSANTTSLASATRVNLWNFVTVLQRTGDFTGFVAVGNNPTMAAPWIFNSNTPALPAPGGATPALWQVGNFTFDLTSSQVISQSSTFLNVLGVGTVSGNGFDPTAGSWSFSSTQSDGSTSQTFSFQSQTIVPEASTLALFGIGGACLFARILGRRKSKAKSLKY